MNLPFNIFSDSIITLLILDIPPFLDFIAALSPTVENRLHLRARRNA